MSWNLTIFSDNQSELPAWEKGMGLNPDPLPFDNSENMKKKISISLPQIAWKEKTNRIIGIYKNGQLKIEIPLFKDSEPISMLSIYITGLGNPHPIIKKICEENNWIAFDQSTKDYLNFNNNSSKGWDKYQEMWEHMFADNFIESSFIQSWDSVEESLQLYMEAMGGPGFKSACIKMLALVKELRAHGDIDKKFQAGLSHINLNLSRSLGRRRYAQPLVSFWKITNETIEVRFSSLDEDIVIEDSDIRVTDEVLHLLEKLETYPID